MLLYRLVDNRLAGRPEVRITQEKIAKLVHVMRMNVLTDDAPFLRAYARTIVDQVEVNHEEIRVIQKDRACAPRHGAGGARRSDPIAARKDRSFEHVFAAVDADLDMIDFDHVDGIADRLCGTESIRR
jgi:hypothetical protein